MKYIKTVKQPGFVVFLADENIVLSEFRSIIRGLACILDSSVEWITMPEAEIAKIQLSTGKIYAKFDFDYGLEINCEGRLNYEILRIEAALLKE